MGGHGNKLRSKGEFKSQVPHVMLHLNPGVARHYGSQVRTLDKLKNKVIPKDTYNSCSSSWTFSFRFS